MIRNKVSYELECTKGSIEFNIQSATGSEWDQRTESDTVVPGDPKNGSYEVSNSILDATVFLTFRSTSTGITKVRCKLSARATSGTEILDVDADGKLFARKLTADEISYILRQDSSSLAGLVDGEFTNKSSKPIIVYGPRSDKNRIHARGLYLLRPGQETVEAWDFDGVYIPNDRKASGNATAGPFAAKIDSVDYGVVKAVDGSEYDINVNFGSGSIGVLLPGAERTGPSPVSPRLKSNVLLAEKN